MMKTNIGDEVAWQMAQTLKDAEFQKMFSSPVVKKASVEDPFADVEVSETSELVPEAEFIAEAGNPRADCVMCGKARQGWTEADGVCKCSTASGCSLFDGCKENCSCSCKVKSASFNAALVKRAFETLMEVSEVLENEGFDDLSGEALALAGNLVAEAKDKSKDKGKAAKEKEKEKAKKLKEKELADKNKAKDRADKEKAKALADKNKAKEQAEKAKMKEKQEKERAKAKAEKEKADAKKAKDKK